MIRNLRWHVFLKLIFFLGNIERDYYEKNYNGIIHEFSQFIEYFQFSNDHLLMKRVISFYHI
jgi:hypothetical protein